MRGIVRGGRNSTGQLKPGSVVPPHRMYPAMAVVHKMASMTPLWGGTGISPTVQAIDVDDLGNIYSAHENKQIIKSATDGQLVWTYPMNTTGTLDGVRADGKGGVYVWTFNNVIARIDANGQLAWSKQEGVTVPQGCGVDERGNFYYLRPETVAGSRYIRKLAPDGSVLWTLYTPIITTSSCMNVSQDGCCFVAVPQGNGSTKVYKVDEGGTYINEFAILIADSVKMLRCTHTGDIYAVYNTGASSHTVARVLEDGTVLWTYAMAGYVLNLAVDKFGNAYTGAFSNSVRRLFPNGTSSATLTYEKPRVAVDSAGNLYVADEKADSTSRIYKLECTPTRAWRYSNTYSIRGIRVGPDGSAYFGYSTTIRKLTTSGSSSRTFGCSDNAERVAIDKQGNVFGGLLSGMVEKFNSTSAKQWGIQLNTIEWVETDSVGNCYAITNRSELVKLSPDGVKLWSITVNGGSYMRIIYDEPTGFVYAYAGKYITKVDTNGKVIWAMDTGASGYFVAMDKAGVIYVPNGKTIKKYSSQGLLLDTIVTPYDIKYIGVDTAGNIYTSNAGNNVVKYNYLGVVVYTINILLYTSVIEFDKEGNVHYNYNDTYLDKLSVDPQYNGIVSHYITK